MWFSGLTASGLADPSTTWKSRARFCGGRSSLTPMYIVPSARSAPTRNRGSSGTLVRSSAIVCWA